MMYDYLIVGAGFAGSVLAERIASQLNRKVLIIDKREHIGGNCYDYYNEENILVHKYGPHIFHTNNKKVWEYLSQFTEWHQYFHRVLAVIDGEKVPVPFNLNSVYQVFPKRYASKLEKLLIGKYGFGLKIPILKLLENQDKDLKFLADYIYKNVFYGYTVKQWDLKPDELDYSVTSRVPVNISRDNRYFQDAYQGIPYKGYTEIFNNMLNHTNIEVLLNTDYKNIVNDIKFKKMIYTGPIDSYFDNMYSGLPYRSLRFNWRTIETEHYQEVAQINFPNNYDYTRITEFKHFTRQKSHLTTIAFEYPEAYDEQFNEPYYPIPKAENDALYEKYRQEAQKLQERVLFTGRLADYKYYNMDQIIGVALLNFEKKIA